MKLHILDLFCGSGKTRKALLKEFPEHEIKWTGIDQVPITELPKTSKLEEKFHEINLNFNNPDALTRQLKILGNAKFDQIHFHMPLGVNSSDHAQKFLQTLASFLKPNGMLFHTTEGLKTPLVMNSEVNSIKEKGLEQYLQKLAENSNLELTHYKLIQSQKDKNELEKYTDYHDSIQHYIIMTKKQAKV